VKTIVTTVIATVALCSQCLAGDPLPSWNDTATKQAIVTFVEKVTKEGSPDFVPPAERIATFDNDGCLWSEQVVGSSIKTKFEMRDGKPILVRLPELNFIDDKTGKPVGINQHIGRRPIAAFGNSDGDLQMLQWTAGGSGARFCLLVHHTDAEREWAYDRDSHIGRLDKALVAAKENGWTVVDMKRDRKVVY
jgi:hypothetical protein